MGTMQVLGGTTVTWPLGTRLRYGTLEPPEILYPLLMPCSDSVLTTIAITASPHCVFHLEHISFALFNYSTL